jgi:hypothetical protein
MTLKEQVNDDLERLDEGGLREVADFMAFLQFRSRHQSVPDWDEAKMVVLYAEFAEEDRALAEAGMADYASDLGREDAAP